MCSLAPLAARRQAGTHACGAPVLLEAWLPVLPRRERWANESVRGENCEWHTTAAQLRQLGRKSF